MNRTYTRVAGLFACALGVLFSGLNADAQLVPGLQYTGRIQPISLNTSNRLALITNYPGGSNALNCTLVYDNTLAQLMCYTTNLGWFAINPGGNGTATNLAPNLSATNLSIRGTTTNTGAIIVSNLIISQIALWGGSADILSFTTSGALDWSMQDAFGNFQIQDAANANFPVLAWNTGSDVVNVGNSLSVATNVYVGGTSYAKSLIVTNGIAAGAISGGTVSGTSLTAPSIYGGNLTPGDLVGASTAHVLTNIGIGVGLQIVGNVLSLSGGGVGATATNLQSGLSATNLNVYGITLQGGIAPTNFPFPTFDSTFSYNGGAGTNISPFSNNIVAQIAAAQSNAVNQAVLTTSTNTGAQTLVSSVTFAQTGFIGWTNFDLTWQTLGAAPTGYTFDGTNHYLSYFLPSPFPHLTNGAGIFKLANDGAWSNNTLWTVLQSNVDLNHVYIGYTNAGGLAYWNTNVYWQHYGDAEFSGPSGTIIWVVPSATLVNPYSQSILSLSTTNLELFPAVYPSGFSTNIGLVTATPQPTYGPYNYISYYTLTGGASVLPNGVFLPHMTNITGVTWCPLLNQFIVTEGKDAAVGTNNLWTVTPLGIATLWQSNMFGTSAFGLNASFLGIAMNGVASFQGPVYNTAGTLGSGYTNGFYYGTFNVTNNLQGGVNVTGPVTAPNIPLNLMSGTQVTNLFNAISTNAFVLSTNGAATNASFAGNITNNSTTAYGTNTIAAGAVTTNNGNVYGSGSISQSTLTATSGGTGLTVTGHMSVDNGNITSDGLGNITTLGSLTTPAITVTQAVTNGGVGTAGGATTYGTNTIPPSGTVTNNGAYVLNGTMTGSGTVGSGLLPAALQVLNTNNGSALTNIGLTQINTGSGLAQGTNVALLVITNQRASASVTMSGTAVGSIAVVYGGVGYLSPPAVTFTPVIGSPATAHTVISSGVVTSVVVDSGGGPYFPAPAVAVIAPPPFPYGSQIMSASITMNSSSNVINATNITVYGAQTNYQQAGNSPGLTIIATNIAETYEAFHITGNQFDDLEAFTGANGTYDFEVNGNGALHNTGLYQQTGYIAPGGTTFFNVAPMNFTLASNMQTWLYASLSNATTSLLIQYPVPSGVGYNGTNNSATNMGWAPYSEGSILGHSNTMVEIGGTRVDLDDTKTLTICAIGHPPLDAQGDTNFTVPPGASWQLKGDGTNLWYSVSFPFSGNKPASSVAYYVGNGRDVYTNAPTLSGINMTNLPAAQLTGNISLARLPTAYTYTNFTNGAGIGAATAFNTYYTNTFNAKLKVKFEVVMTNAVVSMYMFSPSSGDTEPPFTISVPTFLSPANVTNYFTAELGAGDYIAWTNSSGGATAVTNRVQY